MKHKFILLLLFFTSFILAQNDVYVFKDSKNEFTIETIQNAEFILVENQILEKHSDASYWFKIPNDETTANYIFKILYERYNYAEAYQNSVKLNKLNDQRFLSFKFTRDSDVYIKLKPHLHAYIPFELLPEDKSILKNNKQLLVNGFYYGFALLIVIYNLLYYILFKDDAFLYYALFLSSMSFGLFIMDGMLNFYNINEKLNNFLMMLNYIFLAYFSSKFAGSYLLLDAYFPKLKKISYAIGFCIIGLCLCYLFFGNYYFLLAVNVLVFFLLSIYWSISIILFKKNFYVKILTFAYIIILFSGIDYYVLKFLGISFININASTIKIGAFLEMIILSAAVLYRMKILKDENEFMRNEIIKYSKEIERFENETKDDSIINGIENLSIREKEIFDLIIIGNTNKLIADTLNISVNTVKFHVKNIYEKLDIKSRKEAIKLEKTFSI